MSVSGFKSAPIGKGGSPAPPASFSVKPRSSGGMAVPDGGNPPATNTGGLPGGVRRALKRLGFNVKTSSGHGISGGARSVLPGDVSKHSPTV
jgi:hypothetical protein